LNLQVSNCHEIGSSTIFLKYAKSSRSDNFKKLNKNNIDFEYIPDVWTLFFDGSKSQEGARASCLLIDQRGKHSFLSLILEFEYTNNTAEHEALVQGLKKGIDLKIKKRKCLEILKS